jgi:hypothetical protein
VTPKELVRRFNESFVSVSLPPSSISHIEAPHHSTYSHVASNNMYVSSGASVSGSVFADETMWGFGGSIEEIRMAIPGVTTECNACLLTDVNFFVAGDFAGSLQPYSQRRAPLLKMAEQAQLGDMRIEISLDILARKEPMALFHHWLCPVAAALHLQRLYQISRELDRHVQHSANKVEEFVRNAAKDAGLLVSQGSTVDTVRSQMRSLISDSDSYDGPDVAPSMMITIEIPLGLDSDDYQDGITRIQDAPSNEDGDVPPYHNTAAAVGDSAYVSTDNALHAARQQEAATQQYSAKLELAGSTTTSKHTLPDTRSGHPSTLREQNVLVIHSFRTSISARKIANDAEAVLEFPATALNQAKEILARAIDRRRIRLGRYSATKDQTAFKGVASVKTCLGSTPNAPCIETATKGILVGSWTLDELRSRHEAQRFNFTNSFTSGLYRGNVDEDGTDGAPFPEMAYVGVGGKHHSMTSSTKADISSPRGWMPFLCTLLHHSVSAVVVIGIITSLSVTAHQQQYRVAPPPHQGFGGYSRGGAPPPPPPPLVHPHHETRGIAVGVFVAFIVLSYISTTIWLLACLGVWAAVWTTRLMTPNQIFFGILVHTALYSLM